MLLKTHLDLIGRNEPIQRKAKFWQSYVRALRGSDDMRAPEATRARPRGIYRPFSEFPEYSSKFDSWPYNKSIYDEPSHAAERMSVPGYRYLPISRETYGYSPRNIYADRRPGEIAAHKAWDDHLRRLANIESLYPSKYPYAMRHNAERPKSDTWKPLNPSPRETAVAFNYAGLPIYSRGGYTRRPLLELFKPVPAVPASRNIRDPWWYEYPELRPFDSPYTWLKTPSYLRASYLSPVKNTYLWTRHPGRPFGEFKVLIY